MSKTSLATDPLPASAAKALRDLGENLALARQRRKESLRAWASRMGVSVPTLIRMEKGDPSVGMGVYATALWLMGRHAALPDMAAPAQDLNALAQDIEAVRQRGRRMSRQSAQVA
jgi:transcriptional regulator with XRE-family HTH domain